MESVIVPNEEARANNAHNPEKFSKNIYII